MEDLKSMMKEIKKEHILEAIKEIKDNPLLRKGRASTTYDLIYEGKDYPPKLVISIANRYATGAELDHTNFSGGPDKPAFQLLEKEGFEIMKKADTTSDIINVKYEFADWFILNDGTLSSYFSKQFGSNKDLLEKEFDLYEGRYKENFNAELFIIDANNYLNQIKIIKRNIYDKTTEFYKFSKKKSNDRPRAILGKNNYIKFLQEKFDAKKLINYWVFQGSPKIYDMVGALEANAIKTWTVSSHKKEIVVGDKIILWLTGIKSGCYALGRVISPVTNMKEGDAEMHFYLNPTEQVDNNRVSIEIEHNYFNNPVLWETIKEDKVFNYFKGGSQGTNFSATEDEYNILLNMASNKNKSDSPLNQILYGPPGTGKTYNTVLEAAKIITGNALISYGEALEEFNKKLGNQIEFITFHQNYSYEDFIQGIRPDTENGKELSFEKKDGVFKRIADRALKNITDSEQPESAKKDFDAVFQDFILPLIDEDEIEVKMKKTSFYITQISEKSIEFRKNQGDSQHTLSINTLRKMYNDGVNEIILGGLQPYYNPILQVLLEKGKSQFTPVENKNFVIIIDEINRANISRVFGELITLIEEDKRSHGKIPMRVTLPSGDTFIVPSNLYIIGTMNTADKSIALLDIALRRRFEFVPKYPDYTIAGVHESETLLLLNKAIQSRKGYDFTIGHAYFMGDDYTLVNTVNKKVIPLLLEYFMNNEDEVIKIFKEANITIGGWPLKMIL
jgi:hypothetical protein